MSKPKRPKIPRAPLTIPGQESKKGFPTPRARWDSGNRAFMVCQRCHGDGSYVEDGMLRYCNCGAKR